MQAVLVRFVRGAEGWSGDPGTRRAPGRGVYLCSRTCALRVQKNKRFAGLGLVARGHPGLCAGDADVYDSRVP